MNRSFTFGIIRLSVFLFAFQFAFVAMAAGNVPIINIPAATPPTIMNVALSSSPKFYSSVPNIYQAVSYDFDTQGVSTVPVIEQIRDDQDNVVYEFGAYGSDNRSTHNGVSFNWDGTYNQENGSKNGPLVRNGTYTFYILAHKPNAKDVVATKSFEVIIAKKPTLTLSSTPESVY